MAEGKPPHADIHPMRVRMFVSLLPLSLRILIYWFIIFYVAWQPFLCLVSRIWVWKSLFPWRLLMLWHLIYIYLFRLFLWFLQNHLQLLRTRTNGRRISKILLQNVWWRILMTELLLQPFYRLTSICSLQCYYYKIYLPSFLFVCLHPFLIWLYFEKGVPGLLSETFLETWLKNLVYGFTVCIRTNPDIAMVKISMYFKTCFLFHCARLISVLFVPRSIFFFAFKHSCVLWHNGKNIPKRSLDPFRNYWIF